MAEQNQAAKTLSKDQEQLEAKVAKRTAELIKANERLQQEISERKRAEKALQRTYQELEKRVQERTTELVKANESLQREIIERKQAEEALAAEREQLAVTLRSLTDGVITMDAAGCIVLANTMAEIYLRALVDAEVKGVLPHHDEQSFAELLSPMISRERYREVVLKGLPRQVFEVITHPIDTGPQAGGQVLVIRDVTEGRAAQQRAQQQERLAAVGQLAAGIAHDFNNILTSIIGLAELARTQPSTPAMVRQDLERIVHQGRRAAHLIRQILDFSRQSITEKRPLDLVPFIKETIKLLERTIPEDVQITLDIAPARETYTLNADPTQLQQALTNLAVNAWDAMPTGGLLHFQLSHLTLSPEDPPPSPALDMQPGDWLVLLISDTGIGISSEALPHIFEPFFTTKDVDKGTGLGLAQVDGIIKQHEGYIDVKSEVGAGTTFILYLPPQLSLQQTYYQATLEGIPHGQGELILLVEDDPTVLKVAQTMLEYLSYQVVTATNGRQALEVYGQYSDEIKLVLADVTMPEMGGVELAQILHQANSTINVIAMTGYPLQAEAKGILAQGIVDWLRKPLDIKQLAQKISKALILKNPFK